MKKYLVSVLLAALFLLTACGNASDDQPAVSTIPLSSEEVELLEAIGDDIEVIPEADYADMVTEIVYHADSYTGRVIQMEGVYSSNLNGDSIPYVYRTLSNNGAESICGLPLVYLEKELPDSAWIRVYGIVSKGDISGSEGAILEVIAVESLPEEGQKTLEWTGSAHNH